ncbi:MAG: UDP-N-acetylmuramate dehydrogenase [Cryobacterium sp.]|nr:UDP-N-acetylmuramate dehydrogenase [Oligoflexia bacterium]
MVDSDWASALEILKGFQGEIFYEEPLSKHTSFKIGAAAAAVVFPKNLADLGILRDFTLKHHAPLFILGLGSNILAPDSRFPYLVMKTTKLSSGANKPAELLNGVIRTDASLSVAAFLRTAASSGWDGFDFLSGIPGTLGGVVAMNGGTHLGETSDRLLSVQTFSFALNGGLREYTADALKMSYRKNHFLGPAEIVVSATWKYEAGDPAAIREKLDLLFRRRKETQPLDYPSCGSVFKNPRDSGLRAWEVIEKLGLRGHRIGGAQFAEKHPNWILNLGSARAVDVVGLIELAKRRARDELGIEIQEEVKILSSKLV